MISILVPTYKRPQNITSFSRSVNDFACKPGRVEILFGIHDYDEDSKKAIAKTQKLVKISLRPIIIKEHEDKLPHLSYFWNQIYEHAKYDILGFFGDDVIIRTPKWDKIVVKEFAKRKHILVYGDDLHCAHGTCATLFFTHRDTHKLFGFYMPPYFRRSWMDQFTDNVYRTAKRIVYRKDLFLEHVHPGTFSNKMDETYRRLERARPKDASWGACNKDFKRCVQILREIVD